MGAIFGALLTYWLSDTAGDKGEELAKRLGIRKYLALMIGLLLAYTGALLFLKFVVWGNYG